MNDSQPIADDRPPLTLTEDEMRAKLPTVTPKMAMIQLPEGTYIRHGDQWWLIDAQKHGYGE